MYRLIQYSKDRLAQFQWTRKQYLAPRPKHHHRFMYSPAYTDRIERKCDEIMFLAIETEKEMINLRHKAISEGVDEEMLRELEDMVTNIEPHLSNRLIHISASTKYNDEKKTFRQDLKDIREDFRDAISKPIKESMHRMKEDISPIRETVRERAKDIKEGIAGDFKKFIDIASSSNPDVSKVERVKNFIEDKVVKGKTYEEKLKGHSSQEVGDVAKSERQFREASKGRQVDESRRETWEASGTESRRNPLDYGNDVQTMKDDIDTRSIDKKEELYAQHDKKKRTKAEREFYGDTKDYKSREPHVTKMGGGREELLSKDSYELHGEETYDWAVEKARAKGESIEEGRYKPRDTMENIRETARDVQEGIKERAKEFTESFGGIKEKAKDAKEYVEEGFTEGRMKEGVKDVKENIQELGSKASKSIKEKTKGTFSSVENVREVSKDELGKAASNVGEKVKSTAESIKSKGEEGVSKFVDKIEHAVLGDKTEEVNQKLSEGAHVVKEKLEEGAKYVSEKIKEGVSTAKERYEEEQRKKQREEEIGPYSQEFKEEEYISEPSAEQIERTANIIKDTVMGGAYAAKEKLEEGYENVKEKVKQVDAQDIKEGAQQIKDKVQEGYEFVKDKAKQASHSDTMENVKEKVKEGYESVKEKASQVDAQDVKKGAQKVKGKVQEGYEYVKDKASQVDAQDVKKGAQKVKGKAQEGYEYVKDKAKQVDTQDLKKGAQHAKDKVKEGYEDVKEKTSKNVENAKKKATEAKEETKRKINKETHDKTEKRK